MAEHIRGPELAAPGSDRAELPRGGHSVLPEHRVVASYGASQTPALGILGHGSPAQAAGRILEISQRYDDPERPVLPALELITPMALADPGEDGMYRRRFPPETIDRYLEAAREIEALLILDIQPGRSTFLEEMEVLMPYLRQPDVGLGLDPEWNMGPDGVPGEEIGSVDAATVNEVSARLDALVRENDLPQKLLIVHQFTENMVTHDELIVDRPGLDIVLNSDGFGTADEKRARHEAIAPASQELFLGFKLFFNEDVGLMPPREVLAVEPGPIDVIVYQ